MQNTVALYAIYCRFHKIVSILYQLVLCKRKVKDGDGQQVNQGYTLVSREPQTMRLSIWLS